MRAEKRNSDATTTKTREPLTTADSRTMGLVLIGVSTGGPGVLEEILPSLPANFPWPILVAQHMPANFTGTFSRRLNSVCQLAVEEVVARTALRPGGCYVGRGDADLVVTKRGDEIWAATVPSDPARIWHPSVARMVESAAGVLTPQRIVCVMLTGMGNDGADAMTQLHRKGGRTIAEHESTCVVYGMPGELVKQGGADVVLPSYEIAKKLREWLPAQTGVGVRGAR
jgi:two-component system chemotaxis response regulator CheB